MTWRKKMLVLRLAGGGRIAIHPEDVALCQASPWGTILVMASDASRFEVEQSLGEVKKLVPHLWLDAGTTIVAPAHISSIWEDGDSLSYLVRGVSMTQAGASLHEFIEAIDLASAQRRNTAQAASE
jgi:hypothetical protein